MGSVEGTGYSLLADIEDIGYCRLVDTADTDCFPLADIDCFLLEDIADIGCYRLGDIDYNSLDSVVADIDFPAKADNYLGIDCSLRLPAVADFLRSVAVAVAHSLRIRPSSYLEDNYTRLNLDPKRFRPRIEIEKPLISVRNSLGRRHWNSNPRIGKMLCSLLARREILRKDIETLVDLLFPTIGNPSRLTGLEM